jgi:GST-like protein
MIQLYAAGTPNGKKVPIFLEELGIPYELHKLDLGKGDQLKPEYLAINPNGKIPALVDPEGPVTVFESGAILIYLAEKHGKLLPAAGQPRADVLEWLMFQMSAVGPMMGQLGWARRANVPAGIERYEGEVKRLYGVLDGALAKRPYLAGEYSIADIATYPWAVAHQFMKLDVTPWANVRAWLDRVGERPAVKKAMALF